MTIETKARQLLCDGAITVIDLQRAIVQGDSGPHQVRRLGETLVCDCVGYGWRARCSHSEAVALLLRAPRPQPTTTEEGEPNG